MGGVSPLAGGEACGASSLDSRTATNCREGLVLVLIEEALRAKIP